jgi:hypothetical protein
LLAGSLLKCALAMKAGGFAFQGLGFTEVAKSQLLSSLLGRGAGWKVAGYARPDTRGEKTSRRNGERKGASIHVIKLGCCKGDERRRWGSSQTQRRESLDHPAETCRLEVFTGAGRRRAWTAEQKAQIVAGELRERREGVGGCAAARVNSAAAGWWAAADRRCEVVARSPLRQWPGAAEWLSVRRPVFSMMRATLRRISLAPASA